MANKLPSMIVTENALKIVEAVKAVQNELCSKVDIDGVIKVYECKNVIRIDVKYEEQ